MVLPDERDTVDAVYRAESRRVLATLIRLLGDFDLAEEALHDAFAAAVERWPQDGVPANPRAWLVSAGRFKGIGSLRTGARSPGTLVQHHGNIGQRLRPCSPDSRPHPRRNSRGGRATPHRPPR